MLVVARAFIAVPLLTASMVRAETSASSPTGSPEQPQPIAIAVFLGGPLYAVGVELEGDVYRHVAVAIELGGAGFLKESGIVLMPRLHSGDDTLRAHLGAGVAASRYERWSCSYDTECGGWASTAAAESGLRLGGDTAFLASAIGYRKTFACTAACADIEKGSVYFTGALGLRF